MTKSRTFELFTVSSRSARATFTFRILKIACGVFFFFLVSLAIAPAQTFTSVGSFDGSDGAFPQGFLVEDTHGKFYGTTPYGGESGAGTIFEITSWGKLTTLHSFDGIYEGGRPYAGLVRGRTGNLYGVTSGENLNDGGTVFEITPEGKLTTLYKFCLQGGCPDGETPYAPLVQGSNGNFYGTTSAGGQNSQGTIFEVTSTGALATLYSFCSQPNCTDGEGLLVASLVEGHNGNFYGTTPQGGAHGSGTVFEITPKGKLTTLYSFCSQPNCTDGATPVSGLVQAHDGDFYGTTNGTIFKITPGGELTTLYSFDCSAQNCPDGGVPQGVLVHAGNGNFYGTTSGGGASYGGTIFEVTPEGKLTTLYSFCAQPGCVDGRGPIAGLMQADSGQFYGTTFEGGLYGGNDCTPYGNNGCGTVFRLAMAQPDGAH